jgi:hypothetical protein
MSRTSNGIFSKQWETHQGDESIHGFFTPPIQHSTSHVFRSLSKNSFGGLPVNTELNTADMLSKTIFDIAILALIAPVATASSLLNLVLGSVLMLNV